MIESIDYSGRRYCENFSSSNLEESDRNSDPSAAASPRSSAAERRAWLRSESLSGNERRSAVSGVPGAQDDRRTSDSIDLLVHQPLKHAVSPTVLFLFQSSLGARERVSNNYQRCCCCCWGSCYYQIFKVLKLFRSQPIVIKLRLLIGDNIPDFHTVSDF